MLDAMDMILAACLDRPGCSVLVMGGSSDRWGTDPLFDDMVHRARIYANHRLWEEYFKLGKPPKVLVVDGIQHYRPLKKAATHGISRLTRKPGLPCRR